MYVRFYVYEQINRPQILRPLANQSFLLQVLIFIFRPINLSNTNLFVVNCVSIFCFSDMISFIDHFGPIKTRSMGQTKHNSLRMLNFCCLRGMEINVNAVTTTSFMALWRRILGQKFLENGNYVPLWFGKKLSSFLCIIHICSEIIVYNSCQQHTAQSASRLHLPNSYQHLTHLFSPIKGDQGFLHFNISSFSIKIIL